ncbi:hypothetical protein HWN39_10520 [Lactobacillus rhamnosus]|uniref:Uncharacterized protein n=1 Tax=Lacticaseibacillus rhamnosus TaxID=47715 RepID=A0A7Y7QGS8_LACRH|nr:hypothetical protein [Lacticaseibacillus rhamnosus]NVO88912.1 hypothetical protein [Lacticaseibacillus rhamnosus]
MTSISNIQIFYISKSTASKEGFKESNIPILVSNGISAENFFPTETEKEAIYKKWPQAKGNLKMLFQGLVFDIG